MIIPGKGRSPEDVISLLQCLVEYAIPPEHNEAVCGRNDCAGCQYEYYKKELEAPFKEKS